METRATTSRAIAPLPAATTSLLRSALVLPSLPAILTELIQNSLDAQATSVACSFSLDHWRLQCDDNGHGFPAHALRHLGEQRYWTSKNAATGESFGFRGEALISMADCAGLEVVSKQGVDGPTVGVALRGSHRRLLLEGEVGKRDKPGTTVIVRDIFYKWPVRRRPLSSPSARLTLVAHLRAALSTMALLHPAVAFSLTDTSSPTDAKKVVALPKSPDGVLGRWRQLWGRTGVEDVDCFATTGEEEGWTCEGFFSKMAAHSKAQQFIFVNSRPLSPEPLHKLVNTLFQSSSFSRHASTLLTPSTAPVSASTFRKSPKKTAERHPIFLISLKVPSDEVDVTLEPEKKIVEFRNESKVHAYIETIVKRFLLSNNFLSSPLPPLSDSSLHPSAPAVLPQTLTQHFPTISSLRSAPIKSAKEVVVYPSSHAEMEDSEPEPIQYRDAVSGHMFFIDPRTGNSARAPRTTTTATKKETAREPRRRNLKRRLDWEAGGRAPDWLKENLEGWENPVFPSAVGASIPSLPSTTTTVALPPPRHACGPPPLSSLKTITAFFQSTSSTTTGHGHRLDRAALRSARFVAQVDSKFLLLSTAPKVGEGEGRALIMVDQHAASERVRVERLLRDLCGGRPEREVWGEAVPILVSGREKVVISDRKDEFERWGIGIELREKGGTEERDYEQVWVKSVPQVVGERLRSDSKLLQELLRSFVSLLVEGGWGGGTKLDVVDGAEEGDEWGWVSEARRCPPVLLDLVYSKACRGAIMFNDVLSEPQCLKLLAQLAETCFPFQCAHGRPSVVPLVKVPLPKKEEKRSLDWENFGR